MPDQLDDMCDQLVTNLKKLGALDHGLTEQADFDKTASNPKWAMGSHRLNFKIPNTGHGFNLKFSPIIGLDHIGSYARF